MCYYQLNAHRSQHLPIFRSDNFSIPSDSYRNTEFKVVIHIHFLITIIWLRNNRYWHILTTLLYILRRKKRLFNKVNHCKSQMYNRAVGKKHCSTLVVKLTTWFNLMQTYLLVIRREFNKFLLIFYLRTIMLEPSHKFIHYKVFFFIFFFFFFF